MTENEAIEILTLSDNMKKKLPNLQEVYGVAVNALKELQQYRSIGTVNECRIASEKHVAKKITHDATLLKSCTCPFCKNVLDKFETFGDSRLRVRFKYCHFCGQKLDWSDIE